jgi:C-terminal processing protease CtpA/Prc
VVPFGVQISVGKVLFPENEDLEGRGVSPDQKCLPSAEDLRQERDTCYDKAMVLLKKQLGIPEKAETKAASN